MNHSRERLAQALEEIRGIRSDILTRPDADEESTRTSLEGIKSEYWHVLPDPERVYLTTLLAEYGSTRV